MAKTVTVDLSRMQARMQFYVTEFKHEAGDVIRQQAKLFIKQCIGFTPPTSMAQGQNAIHGDLRKIFSPVIQRLFDDIGADKGCSNVDTYRTNKAGNRYRIIWKKLDPSGNGIAAYHHSQQNARGRVSGRHRESNDGNTWRADYVVDQDTFAQYEQKVWAHIGRQKCAWLPAYEAAGGVESRSWITRHRAGTKGAVIDLTRGGSESGKPSMTISNFAPGISNLSAMVSSALRARDQAMGRDIKLRLAGIKGRSQR